MSMDGMRCVRRTLLLAVSVLTIASLGAQSPDGDAARPAFEVASVKPNKSRAGGMTMGIGASAGGGYTATNVPLLALIRQAFQLQDFQILDGPGWISSERYDVIAKAPADAARDQVPLMLQQLLVERFKLTVRTETRELPAYALVMARSDGRRGPQLRPATGDCEPGAGGRGTAGGVSRAVRPDGGPFVQRTGGPAETPTSGCSMQMGPGHIAAGGMSLPQLATNLSQLVNRRVLDRTGLTGRFDIELSFTPEFGGRSPAGAPPVPGNQIREAAPSIFTALQEQLGLKLDATRGPVEVLVIDRVERPTPD